MKLTTISTLLLASASLAACSTFRGHSVADIPSGTGSRMGEFAALDRFVGEWEGRATLVDAQGDYRQVMPAGATGALPSWDSEQETQWVLNGHYLRSAGWHERPGDERAEFVQYVTWVPEENRYRAYYFSDSGAFAEGWIEPDGMDGFKESWTGVDGDSTWRAEREATFVDADTLQWAWRQQGDQGSMELRGTSTRD